MVAVLGTAADTGAIIQSGPPRLGCLAGTLTPCRRQIRSIRLGFTHPLVPEEGRDATVDVRPYWAARARTHSSAVYHRCGVGFRVVGEGGYGDGISSRTVRQSAGPV